MITAGADVVELVLCVHEAADAALGKKGGFFFQMTLVAVNFDASSHRITTIKLASRRHAETPNRNLTNSTKNPGSVSYLAGLVKRMKTDEDPVIT